MFKKKKEKKELAFGKIPAFCKYELFMERYRSAAEIILKEKKPNAETKILDIGCGEGYMHYFFNDYPMIQWFGVDCWKERIEVCKGLGYKMYDLDLNIAKLPFDDNYFDYVVASHVIEHLANIGNSLNEMKRVLKPGGMIMIATPTKKPPFHYVVNWYHRLNKHNIGDTQNAFSAYSLKRFLTKSFGLGMEFVDMRGFRIFSSRKRFNLENKLWFYKTSTWLGKNIPVLTPEVNVFFRKK